MFIKPGLRIILLGFFSMLWGQDIPNIPIPTGAATAEVWSNEIYLFGGSTNWNGNTFYQTIYKYDGASWSLHDSIPDDNVWNVKSVLVGDSVYLISGYHPTTINALRKYNLVSGGWTTLAPHPVISDARSVAAEYLNNHIYLFTYGNAYRYSIGNNTWNSITPSPGSGDGDLSSVLCEDTEEVYLIGYNGAVFYKYNPQTDIWTQLSPSPYQVGSCAMFCKGGLIYCIGGNGNDDGTADYNSIIIYDIAADSWTTDSQLISSERHYIAGAEFQNTFYLFGGFDILSMAVDVVEPIQPITDIASITQIPHRYRLNQNFPNPFNPTTTFEFSISKGGYVSLIIYNLNGQQIAVLADEYRSAGEYSITFDAKSLAAGTYFYKLKSGKFSDIKKFTLVR